MVDVRERLVERWRGDATKADVVRDTLEWYPDGATSPLRLELPAFFARVHGED
jgi:hypothetical protein